MLAELIDPISLKHLSTCIDQLRRAVVVAHVSPDGDAIGSALAWAHFLRSKGKEVDVIMPNAFPDFLAWLPGADAILRYDKHTPIADQIIAKADTIFCLDFNEPHRIDAMAAAVEQSNAQKVLIDHHLHPHNFCQIIISHPEICATSELVFRILWALHEAEKIDKTIATCIYTGMMTDTGGFTYNSNSGETYAIIGHLLTTGIDKDAIYRKVFNTYSENRLRLMGYVLYQKLQVFAPFRAAIITLNHQEQERFRITKGDTEGFVNLPLTMRGIVFSVFLREDREKQMIKVSLRSVGEFPCNKVAAEYFGGGGHRNASGGEHYGTMREAIEQIKKALIKYEKELKTCH